MLNITEIKRHADIRDVWSALGGPKLRGQRGNRGTAFWRSGDGLCIALDFDRNLWFDHRDGCGGDSISLVQVVQGSSFLEAAQWLANHTGVYVAEWNHRDLDNDTNWPADRETAQWWRMSCEALAEEALESLPFCHPERRGLTVLLSTIRSGDASLVEEYRAWRRRDLELTAAMVDAGRLHDARLQRRLAKWLVKYDGEATA